MSSEPRRFAEWKQLLSSPSYRLRLLVFVLIGGVIILLSALVEDRPSVHHALLEFGVTFSAVGLVSFLWDFLGGDPLEHRLVTQLSTLRERVDALHQALAASSDLATVGIERIWPTRGVWEHDPVEGLHIWKTRLCEAKFVDVVSSTFWTRWMHDESFRHPFFASLDRGTQARIVLYHPKSSVTSKRALDEEDRRGSMKSEIQATLQTLAECRLAMPEASRQNLRVGLTTDFYHFAQIIRADDRMLVASYLSGKSGTPSPTSQLRGPASHFFVTYGAQVDLLWNRCQKLSDKDFADILTKKLPDVLSEKSS